MKKSVEKTFEYLKYKKADIIKISDYVFDTYFGLESEHKRFEVVINCENNEKLEIEDEKLSDNQEILDTKKIYSISIFYTDYRNDKDIKISIREGDYETILNISSSDKEWVGSKIAGINEIFDSIEPQNTLYKKYKKILFHYLSLSIGYVSLNFLIKILDRLGYQGNNTSDSETNPFFYILDKLIDFFPAAKYILFILISWGFGAWLIFLWWDKLDRYLESIWPNIEFCFGPEHKQYAKKQRKAWVVIISWILIPVILGILLK